MPPLAADFTGSVEVYVTVKESGDFEFVRFCPAADSIAHSGWMTRDMLHPRAMPHNKNAYVNLVFIVFLFVIFII